MYTNQYDQPFGSSQLQDQVWIADFVFTNCLTVCPPMTAEMADLQQLLREKNIDIQFVSFTVDPTVDTPSILKQYIDRYTDDDSNWHLLTGYSQSEIEEFALKDFNTIVKKPKTADQVIHGTNFYLVNRQGEVVKEYNYIDETYVDQLVKDLNRLK